MRLRPRPLQVEGGWITATPRGPAGYCADHAGEPHATAGDAAACHRKYLVEQTLRLDVAMHAEGPCTTCGTMTSQTVLINGYPRGPWCDDHRTAEHIGAWWHAASTGAAQ